MEEAKAPPPRDWLRAIVMDPEDDGNGMGIARLRESKPGDLPTKFYLNAEVEFTKGVLPGKVGYLPKSAKERQKTNLQALDSIRVTLGPDGVGIGWGLERGSYQAMADWAVRIGD